MPRPPINLHAKVRELLQHTADLPPEAVVPFAHYEQTVNNTLALVSYVKRHLQATPIYEAVYDRHMIQLNTMALVSYVESFERLLKDLAAVCVDHLSGYIADDRFDEFGAKGTQIASHFAAKSIGKAVCESDTWLTNWIINKRFRSLLQDPFGSAWEHLFPEDNQQPAADQHPGND